MTVAELRAYQKGRQTREQKKVYTSKSHPELELVQKPFVNWLRQVFRSYFPHARFKVNPFADVKMTERQMAKAKAAGFETSEPDVQIIQRYKDLPGVVFELKRPGYKCFKQNGELISDKHVQKQAKVLEDYRHQGYYAAFMNDYQKCVEKMCELYEIQNPYFFTK